MLANQEKQKHFQIKKNESVRSGFTLIELLMVIVIISIMSGVILTNLNQGNGSNELEIAALQTVAQLRSLQSDAVNGRGIGGVTACKFQIQVSNGTKTYTTTISDCASTPAIMGSPISTYFSAKKANGTVISTGPDITFFFTSPLGTVNTAGQIVLTSGTENYYVCVNASGNIFSQKNACP